jgi:hypothetical protein
VNLTIDVNESDSHSYRAPTDDMKITKPLGFSYDSKISGSISDMLEACDLVNIYTLQHDEVPQTDKQGSRQINFMFIYHSLTIHAERCGILPLESTFLSDHITLFVDFNIETLFVHPAFGTERSTLRDLELDTPRLVDAYEDSLCKQLKNHSVEHRVTLLFQIKEQEWNNRA